MLPVTEDNQPDHTRASAHGIRLRTQDKSISAIPVEDQGSLHAEMHSLSRALTDEQNNARRAGNQVLGISALAAIASANVLYYHFLGSNSGNHGNHSTDVCSTQFQSTIDTLAEPTVGAHTIQPTNEQSGMGEYLYTMQPHPTCDKDEEPSRNDIEKLDIWGTGEV
ncbi:uncharacterized protein IL334_001316 [Kwoniella shivajii]|uniref:Uncharacterized protein n=1 Tax=Kwoniella shivajii TaxID=564305 RepID=A0ABZ1CT72_9TREE|nr:hypothetical protein IL334_001316 [Kwoniella shivajii]